MKMRRIAAAALILSLAAGGYAGGKTIGQKDKVRIFEETIAGDPKAAEGITTHFGGSVGTGNSYYQKPYWENRYTYGGEQSVEFSYREPDQVTEEESRRQNSLYCNIYTYFDLQGFSELFTEENRETVVAGTQAKAKAERKAETERILKEPFGENAEEYIKELRDSIPVNGSKYAKIQVRDILDYYILSGSIYGKNNIAMDCDFAYLSAGGEIEPENAKQWSALQDFFKIPVLEEEYGTYQLSRAVNGEIYVTADYGVPEGKDAFYFDAAVCETEEAAYFLFDAHTLNGNLVDTSLIPGGFGIYRMPFETKDGSSPIENLETIYPLDPEAQYLGISASSDGKKLFISYYYDEEIGSGESGDGKVTIFSEVIDLAAAKCDEKIKVIDSCEYAIIRDDGDYQLFTDQQSQIRVYHYSAGKYSLAFKIDGMDFESLGMGYLDDVNTTKVLYEEDRLAILNYEKMYDWDETRGDEDGFYGTYGSRYVGCSSAILNVLSKDKHEYCGRLYSNLQDFYDEDSYMEAGRKLREAEKKGATFVTDDKFPTYMQADYRFLKLE